MAGIRVTGHSEMIPLHPGGLNGSNATLARTHVPCKTKVVAVRRIPRLIVGDGIWGYSDYEARSCSHNGGHSNPSLPEAKATSRCARRRSANHPPGAKSVLLEGKRPRSKTVRFPLIVSKGPKVDLTNEQICEHVEFS